MRVLFCKLHFPCFICLCKSSPHKYAPGALKLEISPHVPATAVVASASDDVHDVDHVDEKQKEGYLRSSLRKKKMDLEVQKKKVQWMDFLGKELVEVRQFESSEPEDTNDDGYYSKDSDCMCIIL